jgi:uncharacterized protein
MKCPSCPDSILVMTDRQNVEIDYCPACRGIWLDRGELDKLLEKASAVASTPTTLAADTVRVGQHRSSNDFEDSDFRDGKRHIRGRKKSWLNEIFD